MLDGLRENDWLFLPPAGRELRRIETMITQLEQAHGRAPPRGNYRFPLACRWSTTRRPCREARGHQLVYFEDFAGDEDDDFLERHFTDNSADPRASWRTATCGNTWWRPSTACPSGKRWSAPHYEQQELNLREIGAVMDVTESRVCQLHSQPSPGCGPRSWAPCRRRGARLRRPVDKISIAGLVIGLVAIVGGSSGRQATSALVQADGAPHRLWRDHGPSATKPFHIFKQGIRWRAGYGFPLIEQNA